MAGGRDEEFDDDGLREVGALENKKSREQLRALLRDAKGVVLARDLDAERLVLFLRPAHVEIVEQTFNELGSKYLDVRFVVDVSKPGNVYEMSLQDVSEQEADELRAVMENDSLRKPRQPLALDSETCKS